MLPMEPASLVMERRMLREISACLNGSRGATRIAAAENQAKQRVNEHRALPEGASAPRAKRQAAVRVPHGGWSRVPEMSPGQGGPRSATIVGMADSDDPSRDPDVPPPPKLPDVESPPPEDVLDEVPPKEELVKRARPADEIVEEQPSVEELLDRDR